MLLAAAQGPALPSSSTPAGATSSCRSAILRKDTTTPPTAGLTTQRARRADNATGGAIHIGYVPFVRDASDTSYISRPRFRGWLCPTSKGAPVSGRGHVPVLQEHGPARAQHFQGWWQTYEGVGRGGRGFLSTRPSSTPPHRTTSDLQKTGFPSEGGFFILVSKTC